MAQTIDVKGKSTLEVNFGAGWVSLGIAPSDASFAIQEQRFEKTIHTNESGPDIPAEVLNMGTIMLIAAPLIKFDRDVMDDCLQNVNAADVGQLGTLGGVVDFAQFRITPTRTGARRYTFPKARVAGEPQDISNQWSVEEDQAVLSIVAYAPFDELSSDNAAFYTVDTV